MSKITVENLEFTFEPAMGAEKYDEWTHYRMVWNKPPASQKAVDVIALESKATPTTTWLIEAKDFRVVDPVFPPRSSNVTGLPQTALAKVVDTLAGLADTAAYAAIPHEKQFAVKALAAGSKRVVLHLEPHTGPHTALFPAGFSALVLQKLRQLAKAIDANPLVLNIANTPAAGVPWTVG